MNKVGRLGDLTGLRQWINVGAGVLSGFGLGIVFARLPFPLDANWTTAIATALLVVFTLLLALVGISQIRVVGKQQRKWTTLQACDRFDSDVVLNAAQDTIWDHTHKRAQPNDKIHLATLRLLNYFDAIAIGIAQGLYIDELARDHLGNIMKLRLAQLRALNEPEIDALFDQMPEHHRELHALLKRWSETTTTEKYVDSD